MSNSFVALLRKIPLEAYVLIVFPCMGLFAAYFLFDDPYSTEALLFFLFYCSKFFIWLFIFLYAYFAVKIIIALIQLLSFKSSNREFLKKLLKVLKEQIYFNLIMFFGAVFMGSLLKQLPKSVSVEKIARSSERILRYDYLVFGVDLLFWTSEVINRSGGAVISWIFLQAYNALPLAVTLLAFAFFLKNKLLARKFLIFFFIITVASVPLWYLLPTLNPIGFYIANKLNLFPPVRIAEGLAVYAPDPVLAEYQRTFSADYLASNILDVSAFPSLHAGYSVGIILYAFFLWRRSLFLTLPWFALEMAGAVHLGQHYGIDLIYGSVLGAAIWGFVEYLFALEKKYYTGRGSLFIADTMQADARSAWVYTKAFFGAGKQTHTFADSAPSSDLHNG